jgi:phosphopantetheinyl transferase (holo-ACP synthase)
VSSAVVEALAIDLRRWPVAVDLVDGPRPSSPVADHAVALAVADLGDPARAAERWLTDAERAVVAQRGERGRVAHLAGRVAAKQAAVGHLAARGFAELTAGRLRITNDDAGCPVVSVRGARVAARHLRVSIAHSARVAVAVASARPGAAGIGIDVEPVEPRSHRFESLTLTPAERELAPVIGDDRDTWLTRLWGAKEAAAKATGLGLRGRPKAFEVVAVDDERLLVDGRWIATEVVAFGGVPHIVALTADHPTERTWHRS